jgi:hypothetical protein
MLVYSLLDHNNLDKAVQSIVQFANQSTNNACLLHHVSGAHRHPQSNSAIDSTCKSIEDPNFTILRASSSVMFLLFLNTT